MPIQVKLPTAVAFRSVDIVTFLSDAALPRGGATRLPVFNSGGSSPKGDGSKVYDYESDYEAHVSRRCVSYCERMGLQPSFVG